MPEGDTIFKLARYLAPALVGQRVIEGFARGTLGVEGLDGFRVERVSARGKHLFIAFDNGQTLRSHLGMWGSWHGYAPGERWQRPRRRAAIVIDIGSRVFACFQPLEVELLHRGGVRERQLELTLGPDLLTPPVDMAAVVGRARALAGGKAPLVDVLLDQRIACGIGNVFKSEVLFLERLHPMRPLAALDDSALGALYSHAARLMSRNTRGGPRVTRSTGDPAGRLWVYGRSRQPCHACGHPVRMAHLGRGQRSTYWCDRCQGPAPNPA